LANTCYAAAMIDSLRKIGPAPLFALILVVGVIAWVVQAGRTDRQHGLQPLQAVAEVPTTVLEPLSVDEARTRARAATSCQAAMRAWWEVIRLAGDDLEAYKAIASCQGGSDGIDSVVGDTTRAFEQSRVLGVVPTLLDVLDVRDVVPILNQVQAQKSGDADALRQMGELRLGLGDLEGAVSAFEQSIALDPDDAEGPIRLGYALVDAGRIADARASFRQGLANQPLRERVLRAYAMAVAWPIPFGVICLGVLGLGVSLWVRADTAAGGRDALTGWSLIASALAVAVGLGLYFMLTADKMAFGLIVLATSGVGAWILFYPLRGAAWRVFSGFWENVALIAAGQIHHRLARLPWAAQLGILGATVVGIIVFLPRVQNVDLFLFLAFLSAMLLFSTVGALLLRLLDESRSLVSTLRWLGIAGTLPFLLFFLYFERESLLTALFHGWTLDRGAQNRLAGYLIVWSSGLFLAILLARILATAILDPLGQIIGAIARVRNGELDLRVDLPPRKDEIGALALAVDEMALGLRQREQLKETFRKYIDPRVAEKLMHGDEGVTKGNKLHATVLFADLRGFTARSEDADPTDVVGVLNEYLGRMEPVIRRWGGSVDKFLGDGILAVWDVPEPLTSGEHAGVRGEELAVRAAIGMVQALEAFNEELGTRGIEALTVGVGINAGEVIAGPVGSRERQEYTVIGDVVNTAQRIESQARGDTPILVSEAVAAAVRGKVELVEREPIALKGKKEPVTLWSVTLPASEPAF
jgi:class 3 adenylate cyclase/tetratricopeptide (TPR) repeat protein